MYTATYYIIDISGLNIDLRVCVRVVGWESIHILLDKYLINMHVSIL